VKVSAGRGGKVTTPRFTSHDHVSLPLAETTLFWLYGPLPIAVAHEVLGADIYNGVKPKKIRMSRFFPLVVITRFERSVCHERPNAKSKGRD
jgi:hypothetical protein